MAAPGPLLFVGLLAACAPAELAPPPAPRASFASYQIGADAPPPPRPPADEYADLFAFRESGRPARDAAEPWPPGASLRGGDFTPHRQFERKARPRREPAAPSGPPRSSGAAGPSPGRP